MNYRSEWRSGHEFAELAEALGITTKQIMAARMGQGKAVVFFTDEVDEDEMDIDAAIFFSILTRDDDKILRPLAEPQLATFTWATLSAGIEDYLRAELGDPDDHA